MWRIVWVTNRFTAAVFVPHLRPQLWHYKISYFFFLWSFVGWPWVGRKKITQKKFGSIELIEQLLQKRILEGEPSGPKSVARLKRLKRLKADSSFNQLQNKQPPGSLEYPRTFRYFRCGSKASSPRGQRANTSNTPWEVHVQFWPRFHRGLRGVLILVLATCGLHDTMTFSSWCIHGSACRAGGRFLLGRFRLDVWWYGVPLLLRGAVIDSIGCWDWQGGCINVRDGQWSRGIVVVYITFLRRNKVENPPSQQKTRLPRHPCPVWL